MTNLKNICQRHCFSALNHNLGYCYNDVRVIKWLWKQAKNRFQGRAKASKISSRAYQQTLG